MLRYLAGMLRAKRGARVRRMLARLPHSPGPSRPANRHRPIELLELVTAKELLGNDGLWGSTSWFSANRPDSMLVWFEMGRRLRSAASARSRVADPRTGIGIVRNRCLPRAALARQCQRVKSAVHTCAWT